MDMWQRLRIYMARNEKVKSFFQLRRKLVQLANKFVCAMNEEEAVQKGNSLKSEEVCASFFHLGEYENDLGVVDKTMKSLLKMIQMLSESEMDIHVSVDPTQVGLQFGKSVCLMPYGVLAKIQKILNIS